VMLGYELIKDVRFPWPISDIVLQHHERLDGSGYPQGLKGAEIPVGSRVILVADAFDALTTSRSYRTGVSVEAAMHELQAESGRQFDPLVVAALHDVLTNQHKLAELPEADAAEPEWSFSTSQS